VAFGTIVDCNVLLDLFTDDERWGAWSAEHLASACDQGSVIINVLIYAELSVGFGRSEDLEHAPLDRIEREDLPWTPPSSRVGGSCGTAAEGVAAARRCRTSTSPPTQRPPAACS